MTTEGAPSPDQVTGSLYVHRRKALCRMYDVCYDVFDPAVWGVRRVLVSGGFFRRSSAKRWIATVGR